MRSSMKKTTRREIRNSFGRYLAILSIVALGVGLFSGLMISTPDMIRAGGDYMNGNDLYDVRLVSTLGFDRDAAQQLAELDGVKASEGAVSADVLAVDESGAELVLTAQTLLPVQNQVVLVSGRLPETGQECVVDALAFPEEAVGTALRISDNNGEETLDLFAETEYVITGRVNASAYTNHERGTSSLGNGRVQGFFYLPREGFEGDYDTEIFLRLDQDYGLYSDEYEAAAEDLKDRAEPLAEAAAFGRYESLVSDAEGEIADAEEELKEETQKAQEELDDALKSLLDGEAEIADGEEQLSDAQSRLDASRAELDSGWRELSQNEADLVQGRSQAEAGQQQLAQARQQLEAALSAMDAAGAAGASGAGASGAGMVDAGTASAQRAELEAQLSQLEQQEAGLQAQLARIEAGEAELEEGRQRLRDAERQLADGQREIEENRQELEDAREKLADGRAEYEDGLRELEEETEKARQEIADAREELEDLEEPEVYVLGRETNLGYALFENDADIVAGVARVFPAFFFLVAALVCVTTMNRMVEEQRTQIGVLKALGYGEGRIMGKYLYYSGSAAVLGAVIGFAAGCVIFPTVIWQSYGILYTMGDIHLLFDWKLAAISLAVALLCSMGTTCLTCRYELTSPAAELMRPKPPKTGKRIWLERIPALWGRLSFLAKVSFRNVVRYKSRFFMMVVGIGGCTALLLTGFGLRDSIVNVAKLQYEEIQRYDLSVTLEEDVSADGEAIVDAAMENGAVSWTAVSEKAMDLTGKGGMKSVSAVILKEPERAGEFLDLHTEKGDPIPWPKAGEAVLDAKTARTCGIQAGDTATLENEDGDRLEVTVVALCENFVSNYAYIGPETWEADNGGPPEYRNLYLNVSEDAQIREISRTLLDCEGVSAVSANADQMDRITNMMGSLDAIVLLVILCAGALAFIVIYNLTNINITERIREIATIKVLGFYPGETAAYVFRENAVLTAIGAGVGLLLGILLHRFVMDQIDIDMVTFDVRIAPFSYLLSILLTFVFMAVVDVFMYVRLEKINMAESLKSIE